MFHPSIHWSAHYWSPALRTTFAKRPTITSITFHAFHYGHRPFVAIGSAALDLCYVASGRFDGYREVKLSPWDMAAESCFVREAEVSSGFSRAHFSLYGQELAATNGHIHDQLRRHSPTRKQSLIHMAAPHRRTPALDIPCTARRSMRYHAPHSPDQRRCMQHGQPSPSAKPGASSATSQDVGMSSCCMCTCHVKARS